MNGFMQWFKSSNKMKRWMFLILIGIILMCYGIAETLILKEKFEEEIKNNIGEKEFEILKKCLNKDWF